MEIIQRKNREYVIIDSVDEVINVLRSKFSDKKLYIKYAPSKVEITINEYLDDNSVMLVTDANYVTDEILIVYGLSDKYIEFDFEIIEKRAPGYYKCKIKSARRALKGRKDLRFKVNPDELVVTNFRVSKQTIDISGFNIPTSIKVVLEQFQNTNSKMSDIVKVDIFSSESSDYIMNSIKKTGKSLFIQDVSDPESYKGVSDDFIDLYELYGNELKSIIKRNIERGYKSIIIVPIIYITETESSVPFAYIQVISKTENFTLDKVLELKDHTFKIVDRIRGANTLLIPVHQQVVDISRGGAKLKITDGNLKKYLFKSKGFIFDLVFKLQAPITIYGEIKVTYTDKENNLYVGIDFEGNSSRKDEMKRFYAILKPMEAEYKEKLIKSIKQKKK